MKKLLLIPVIAVSLLTGCDSSSTVTINDWFETINEKTTWGRYALLNEDDLYEGDNYDFDLYTANLIKENVKDAKIKKKNIKEFDKGFKVSYEAKNSYNEYSEFKVFVYEAYEYLHKRIHITKNPIGAELDKVISKTINQILSISRIALKDFHCDYDSTLSQNSSSKNIKISLKKLTAYKGSFGL